MKRIRLNDLEQLKKVIDDAEGRAQKRWISAEEVVNHVKNWEKRCFNLPKKILAGCKMKIQACASTVAKSYRYIPYETVVYLIHDTKDWYIDEVRREPMKGHSWNVEVTLTDNAKERVLLSAARM